MMTNSNAIKILTANGIKPGINEDKKLIRYSNSGDVEVVMALIECGVPVDVRDENKRTPLIRAAEANHTSVINALIDAGADTEAKDKDGDTALITAVNWGSMEAVSMLLERGANINNISETNGTALCAAIRHDKNQIFDLLLKNGADANIVYSTNIHALYVAIINNLSHYVEKLLSAGANINLTWYNKNRTPLMLSITKNFQDIAFILVNRGADLNLTDLRGWTAMGLAQYFEHKAIIDFLEKKGASYPEKNKVDLLNGVLKKDKKRILSAIKSNADINSLAPCGSTALMLAVNSNNTEIINLILSQNPKIDTYNPEIRSPLMRTVEKLNFDVVKSLLDKGASVKGGDGWSPLVSAAQNDNLEMVKLLIENDAPINEVDTYHQSALIWAVAKNNVAITKYLIDHNIDVNLSTNGGRSPVHLAAAKKNFEILQLLIDARANINATDNIEKNTALHNACSRGDIETATFLIKNGAECGPYNFLGESPIDTAFNKHHTDCAVAISDLITNVIYNNLLAETKQKDNLNASFYSLLISRMHLSSIEEWIKAKNLILVKGLIEAGFSKTWRNGKKETLLMVATKNRSPQLVDFFIKNGADVHAHTQYNRTALHYACSNQNEECILKLLEAGADPNLFDEFENSAMSILAEKDNPELMEIIYEKGALLEKGGAGEEPLIRAARFKKEKSLKWLLDKGANPNVRTSNKETPLYFAVKNNNISMTKELLTAGANPDEKNKSGRTPAMEAAQSGAFEILKLLVENKADLSLKDNLNLSVYDCVGNREEIKAYLNTVYKNIVSFNNIEVLKLKEKNHLQKAAILGNVTAVKDLLSQAFNIDEKTDRGDTALMLAAEHGQIETVKLLLEAGASIKEQNNIGETALCLASPFEKNNTKELFLKAGEQLDINKMVERMSRIEALSNALQNGSFTDTQNLISSDKVDIDCAMFNGNTPLHICAHRGDADLLNFFFEMGANPEVPNFFGTTVLMTAIFSNQTNIAKILLNKGVSTHKQNNIGYSALLYAAKKLNVELVQLLLESETDIKTISHSGNTALIVAAGGFNNSDEEVENRLCIIKTLIEAGIDVNAVNNFGETALVTAVMNSKGDESLKIVETLLKAGADPSKSSMPDVSIWELAAGKKKILNLLNKT